MRHLQAGIRAIDKDKLDDIAVLEGAIKSRKDSVSDAAAEVTAAAKKMIEVLVYLRHAGEISDEQFDSVRIRHSEKHVTRADPYSRTSMLSPSTPSSCAS